MRQGLQRAGSAELVVDRLLLAGQVLVLVGVAAVPELALAQATMPGQQLLLFARNYIIAPIALFAIVITGVAAFIRPDLIKRPGTSQSSPSFCSSSWRTQTGFSRCCGPGEARPHCEATGNPVRAPVYRNLDARSTFLGLAFPAEWMAVLAAGWLGTANGAPNVGAAAELAIYLVLRIAGHGRLQTATFSTGSSGRFASSGPAGRSAPRRGRQCRDSPMASTSGGTHLPGEGGRDARAPTRRPRPPVADAS